jgi:hypothetical protein
MFPTLVHEKDSVYIEPLKRPLAAGDIPLVAVSERQCVLHRVTRVDKNHFYMQGDACRKTEGPLPFSTIIGLAVKRKREGEVYVLPQRRPCLTIINRAKLWIPVSIKERMKSVIGKAAKIGSQADL